MRSQRGIGEVALIGGIVVALVVGGLFLATKVLKSQRDAARAETVKVQAEYDTFVEGARKLGEEQEAAAKAQEAKQQEVFDATRKRYLAELATRDAAIRRLRERPPERPDSSQVPVTACRAEGTDAASGEFVPLAEYRELEARCFNDARSLTRLQQWVIDSGHPIQ